MSPAKSFFRFLLVPALIAAAQPSYAKKPDLTEWNYLPSYGQSLSVGWTAKPVVTTEQKDGHLMFKGGVRPYETGNDRSALVPLVESVSPDNNRGETPIAGAAGSFTRLLKQKSPGPASKIHFLCSANGVGGISISGLTRGQGAYNRILDDLKAGKELADQAKKTFSMPGFVWTQGETDQQNKQTAEWYKERMKTLIRDIDADAKAITGQTNDVLCFGYQVGSHLNYFQYNPTDYPVISVAQLDLALEEDSPYIMTTPMYHFTYSDGVHLTAPMSRLYGEYVGYVMKKVLVDGVKWKPVHPVSHKIKKSGNEWAVDVQFFAPVPPLVLDTKAVTDPGSFGFTLVTEQGEPQEIKSVALSGKNTVRLITASDPSGCHLRYGMNLKQHLPSGPKTGARGCLRDSQGDKVKTKIQDTVYRMDNWCPFFDYSLAALPASPKTK